MRSSSRPSRRRFITTAAAGASIVWVPSAPRGYADAKTAQETANDALVGMSKWDLDTPALCVDLDAIERNIAIMRERLAATKLASRPHAKTHKCPAIAKLQLAGGSIGICAAKVSEAEVFAANGIDRILMTTANVTPAKIRRAMQIRKTTRQFIQAVDHPQNARD
ncbi:MAG: alanine racemase, partial [Vicinamibacteraceae bacterium]